MSEAEPPRLTVAAVARRLGVAPATLRTWDRRYGVGPSARSASSHRRYSADDVARLEHMRALVLSGVPAAEAAAAARSGAGPRPDAAPTAAAGPGGAADADPGVAAARLARAVARAAAVLDADAVRRLVAGAVDRFGVAQAWDTVLVPPLQAAGARWAATGSGVEVEHLLAHAVLGALHASGGEDPPPPARPVLLASAPEDYHDLPLHVVRAVLAADGVPVRLLGAATPVGALGAAARRLNPAAVVVWASLPAGRADAFPTVPHQRPPVAVFAAGPGWDGAALPAGVERLQSLREARTRLAEVARRAAPRG